jgi:leucyl-tRNA synthetase
MMPHLAEECWAALGHDRLVAEAPWPALESGLLVEDTITLPVQVNGKKRADVTVAREAGTPKSRPRCWRSSPYAAPLKGARRNVLLSSRKGS